MKRYIVPLLLISSISAISQAMEKEERPSFFSNIGKLFSRQSSQQNLNEKADGSDCLSNVIESGSESISRSGSSQSLGSITPSSPTLRSSAELKTKESDLPAESEKESKLENQSHQGGADLSALNDKAIALPKKELNAETNVIESNENQLKELGAFIVAAQNAVKQEQITEDLTQRIRIKNDLSEQTRKWALIAHRLKKNYSKGNLKRKEINIYLSAIKSLGIKLNLHGLEGYESPDEFSYSGSFDPKRTIMKINNGKVMALEAEDTKYDEEEKRYLAQIEQINEQLRTAEMKLGETKYNRQKKQTEKTEILEVNALLIDLQRQDHSDVVAKIESLKKEITASYELLNAEHKKIQDENDLTKRSKMRNESAQFMKETSDKITTCEKRINQLESDKKSIADRLTPEQLKATGVWKKTFGLK